jgi:hypothetical protein
MIKIDFMNAKCRHVLAGLVAACTAVSTLAADARDKPAESEFIGIVQPVLESVGPDPTRCPDASHPIAFRLSGLASTSLGTATVVQSHCEDKGNTSFRRGEQVMTLSEGDRLTSVYAGRILRTLTTAADGVLVLDGRYQYTGGTGRFERASGSGLSVGTVNIRTGTVMITLAGTL